MYQSKKKITVHLQINHFGHKGVSNKAIISALTAAAKLTIGVTELKAWNLQPISHASNPKAARQKTSYLQLDIFVISDTASELPESVRIHFFLYVNI